MSITEWGKDNDELVNIIKLLEEGHHIQETVDDLSAYYSMKYKKSSLIQEIDKDIKELKDKSRSSVDFQNLTLKEILKRIRCKCKILTNEPKLAVSKSSIQYTSAYSYNDLLDELDFSDDSDDDDELITCSKVKKALTRTLAKKLKSLNKNEINYKAVVTIFAKYADERIKKQYTKKGMLQRRFITQTFFDRIVNLMEEDISVKELEKFIHHFFQEVFTDEFFLAYNEQTTAAWNEHHRVHGIDVPAYANEFSTIKEFAFYFVDNILAEAVSKVNVPVIGNANYDNKSKPFLRSIESEETIELKTSAKLSESKESNKLNESNKSKDMIKSSESKESGSKKSILSSVYTGIYDIQLTPKEGRDQIKRIVDKWTFPRKWVYCIDFLGEEGDSCTDFYKYEVKFSKPTKMYPIPQVTASVFFTIEKSRIKPIVCPPKITYNFETERYKFSPTDKIQQQQFLEDIMLTKLSFFKKIRF